MSHGIPRLQPHSTDSVAASRQQIASYKQLVDEVTTAVSTHPDSSATLQLISKLLQENPEFYTIWNHRRRVLTRQFAQLKVPQQNQAHLHEQNVHSEAEAAAAAAAVRTTIQSDLSFLQPLLLSHPKCYWIWNHRLWLLTSARKYLPRDDATSLWRAELVLVSKLLQRDGRNFHGWDYRRRIVAGLVAFASEVEDGKGRRDLREEEFAYTTKMVKANLSNFSAWHYRSRLIPELLDDRGASEEERRGLFEGELAFVKEALFVDPYDQSLWFYHQHLMSVLLMRDDALGRRGVWVGFTNHDREAILRREITDVRELLEDANTHDCKWIYQSLLEYAQEYLKIEGAATQTVTTLEMREWLQQLNALDPARGQRWHDLGARLGL